MKANAVPWWVSGDWNAFLGLFANLLANILVGASLLAFVVKIPFDIVYTQIVPAMGIAIFAGNLYYAYMARRDSLREGSRKVALPYGPSVGHLFVVTFMIIFPVYRATNNPTLAWQVGIAWCMVESVTEIVGSFIGPWLRKVLPRASMLAVMAGIAICLIAMTPVLRTWEAPYIGLISLALILVSWMGHSRLPGNLPAAVWMIIVGVVIAWGGTLMGWIPDAARMSTEAVSKAWAGLSFSFPSINISWEGFANLAPYLVTAIPLGIGGFLNTLDNVESAAAAGDEYDTREAMLADAGGSIIGAIFGNPFATGVYVGHAGWKSVGAGPGYAAASGIATLLVCLLGIVPLFQALIPLVAVLPILLYIGLVMGAQAFQATPSKHAPAVVMALIPWIASWGKTLVDNALQAAGTSAAQVGIAALASNNVLYAGLAAVDQGALLTSMLMGAATAYIIDQKYKNASITMLIAAVFSYLGLMHAPTAGWGAAPGAATGYLLFAVLTYVLASGKASGDQGKPEQDAAD